MTIQATPAFPWEPLTLYAMVSSDLPYATWTGGYHDVIYTIRDALSTIGINLEIRMYDSWTIWSTCWEENYNVSSEDDLPPTGWDMTMSDWWISETSTIWVESFCAAEWTPPLGYNIGSWNNSEADEILRAGIYTLDAETRKTNLDNWQALFMHEAPMINLFYPSYYDVTASYVKGHAGNVWFSTVDHFALNAAEMPESRKALGETTFYIGMEGDMPNCMSLYMSGYTQSGYTYLTHDSLYMSKYVYDGETNEFTYPVTTEPMLAKDFPLVHNDTTLIVPVRDDVWWVWPNNTKSEKFDGHDVAFSLNLVVNPNTGSPNYGEVYPALESAEVLSNATLTDLGYLNVAECMYEPYAVQLNLKVPFGDILEIISMNWGGGMLPEHLLGGIDPRYLRTSEYYRDPSLWCFTGPYVFDHWEKGEYLRVKANEHYYGRNMSGIVDYVQMKIIPEDETRIFELETHLVDALEFTWAPVETIYHWRDEHPDLHVYKYSASQGNFLMFNLHNSKLSNRYIREAIAHIIPYSDIYNVIQGWGIDEVIPGKSPIVPHCTYTEPDTPDPYDNLDGSTQILFNEALEPYTTDPAYAVQCMNMWWYSQVGEDWTLGPVGDGDFSGFVEADDLIIWANAIVHGTLTPPWPRPPAQDIDPDYDNNGVVEGLDYFRFRDDGWGNEYP